MAFHPKGFRTTGILGVPSAAATTGSVRQKHTFVTTDDKAAIETANYFDPLLTPAKKVQIGDLLEVAYNVGAAPGTRTYAINIVANHVVLVPAAVA